MHFSLENLGMYLSGFSENHVLWNFKLDGLYVSFDCCFLNMELIWNAQ